MNDTPTVTLSGSALTGVGPHPAAFGLPPLATAVKLGCVLRPTPPPERVLSLADYLDADVAAAALPESTNRAAKAMASLLKVMLNDQMGDCVIAGQYHQVGLWSGNDGPATIVGTDPEVYAAYQRLKAGAGDSGCIVTDVLNSYRDHGLTVAGQKHTIDGYVSVDWTRKDLVRAGIYLFGAVGLAVNLPEDWTRSGAWDVTNSRIVGGHYIPIVDYTADGVKVSSWGRIYLLTWRALCSRRYVAEAYAMLAPDWYGSDRISPTKLKTDALRKDLAAIALGRIPALDPEPDPPAPPDPTPTPTPEPTPGGFMNVVNLLKQLLPFAELVARQTPTQIDDLLVGLLKQILPLLAAGDKEAVASALEAHAEKFREAA